MPTTPAPPRFHIAEASPADDPRLAASINLGAANSGPAGLLSSSAPASPHVISGPVGRGLSSNRINVSTGVLAGLLLAPIRPDYPPIARISRTQGTVVIQAIISKSGTIESARILRGPVLLQDAALQAVRSARYHPYLLNNEPTEVETTISINFILNN